MVPQGNTVDLNFIRRKFTEAELESAIIGLFQEQDYDYVLGETIHHGVYEILLTDDFRSYFEAQYPDLTAA
jgi:type I restriction enzyme R subunit